MTAVLRMRAYRERLRVKRIVFSVGVDRTGVVEMLRRAELLPPCEVHSRKQITEALEGMIARMCERRVNTPQMCRLNFPHFVK